MCAALVRFDLSLQATSDSEVKSAEKVAGK
jgi:hypothetical protein